jgi:hypothetical protein
MRLAFWSRRDCECACAKEPQPAKSEPNICRMSPARLLANSLTDPETRGEWRKEGSDLRAALSHYTRYRNDARNITIARWWASYGGSGVVTPFTLSEAEEKVVKAALTAFDRHQADLREAETLARLTAPREGLKSDRSETPKSGSTAKRRKPGPSGRAQKDTANA